MDSGHSAHSSAMSRPATAPLLAGGKLLIDIFYTVVLNFRYRLQGGYL